MRRAVVIGFVIGLAACGEPPGDELADAAFVVPHVETTPRPVAGPHAIAFVDIAAVTMETADVTAHQTVIVEGSNVTAIGPAATIEVPDGAERVDGRGKFLIPGLHDMHVHLDGTRGMLALFVGSGVTTVRNMAGSPRTIALRTQIAKGELLGPRIFTAGPFGEGDRPRWEASYAVATPADAERVIDEHVAAGYDFVKIYNGLTLEAYDALAVAARAHDLRLVGHVPFKVPLAHVLESGQASIEHLAGYAEAIERANSPVRHRGGSTSVIKRWMYADHDRIPDVAAETARHGVWNCPTLVTSVAYGELYRGHLPVAGELDSVSPDWRARWDPAHSPRKYDHAIRRAMEEAHTSTIETESELVRELVAAGAPLLAGTDTPNPYVVPGASLHQELALLVAAGLTPYAALRSATIDAADFLGDVHDGRIAAGARADLVILDADPLADIHAIDKIDGVMVHGTWLSADKLRALHDGLVDEYRAPPWEAAIELGPEAAGLRTLQFVISDNGAPVGAYAMARHGGTTIERQTLEDDTETTRSASREVAIDVERAEGATRATFHRTDRPVIGALTPATAYALVEPLVLEVDDKLSLSVATPDPDAPAVLRRAELAISRLPGSSDAQRVYRLRLVLDRVAQVARIVLDGDSISLFKISSTTRPVVRTWRRR